MIYKNPDHSRTGFFMLFLPRNLGANEIVYPSDAKE